MEKGLRCEWPKCHEEADVKAPDGRWYCTEHNGERIDKAFREAITRPSKRKHRRASLPE